MLALVDFSPDATRLKAGELKRLPFADQIEIFYLGYGLWDENANKKWRINSAKANGMAIIELSNRGIDVNAITAVIIVAGV